MVRTIVWYGYFWFFMACSLLLVIPVFFLHLVHLTKAKHAYIQIIIRTWAKSLLFIAGGNIIVKGREKIPPSARICFVANHQGSFDIPIILAYLPGPIGFIAKKELKLLPIVNLWMVAIGCIFLDRTDRRGALEVLQRADERIRQGHKLILFPEGTRSRGPQLNDFKRGSLKLPIRSRALIIPVTISGSYQLLEQKGKISPAQVHLTVHDPIDTASYGEDETASLAAKLKEIIGNSL